MPRKENEPVDEVTTPIVQQPSLEDECELLKQRLELVLNSASEGILGLDAEGRVTFANKKASQLLEWPTEELIGRSAHETFHDKTVGGREHSAEQCPIQSAIGKRDAHRVTNDTFWRRNGRSFRVDYTVATIRAKSASAILTFRDISEEVAADARLKLQEQQYRLLFQSNPNPMYVFELSTLQILAVNDAAITQYGYTESEFSQLSVGDLRAPEETQELGKALDAAASSAHFNGQFQHLRKDRSRFHVDIYSSAVVWDGLSARMATAIDCTKRQEAEARLRQQAQILDQVEEIIVLRSVETEKVLFWNKAAERLLGWTAEERVGSADVPVVEQETVDMVRDTIRAKGEFRGELKLTARDGRELTCDVRATLVRGTGTVLLTCTDVTERKKLEQQFLRVQRLESIGTLASGVAHDLNNIIAPIMTCAPLLRDSQDDERREKLVELIEESAHRGAELVNQVLTFARGIEGERLLLQPQHLISDVANIAKHSFPKNIEVRTRYPQDIWPVEGDATQLHQVLLNLCVNARDAMDQGGVLTLTAENFAVDPTLAAVMPGASAGPHVLFAVTDTGTGISRDVVDKIFDPFFTTKEPGKGTGLGLSTAVGIIKSHGGFMNVYSEKDKGTTFKVFIPAASAAEQEPSASEREARPRGRGETVLVIEDEESIRSLTETILSAHGYKVVTAADGPEALAVFTSHADDIQVVLTDIGMPHIDGVTLARALKKLKPNVHVIASTGRGDDPQLLELKAAGVAVCLTKPFDAGRLLQTLHQLLQQTE